MNKNTAFPNCKLEKHSAICEIDCIFPNGKIQNDCITCEYYVKK